MGSPQDTIAAIATPLGEGGLGVIRLSGPSAIPVASSIFRSSKNINLKTAPSHTCYVGVIFSTPSAASYSSFPAATHHSSSSSGTHHSPSSSATHHSSSPAATGRGTIKKESYNGAMDPPSETTGDDDKEKPATIIDQIVLTLFRAPNSYTGEDVVELSAHGSPFILQQILQECFRNGARAAEPGEFTQRAFLSGKLDLTQAEAVAELIRAKTEKSHHAAMAQLKGHLADEIRGLRDRLLPLLAHVEVGLDHSDEDHDFLQRERLAAQCADVQSQIDAILQSARVGKILREGLRVALVGRPNVGKSSLLNALLKEDRAIVTPIAGTTRDTLEETAHWNGLTVILTDTAGLRDHSQDPVEQLGMGRTQTALEKADVVLGLFDGSEPFTDEDRSVVQKCLAKAHLWIITKSDLPTAWDAGEIVHGHSALRVSSKTGQGLPELVKAVHDIGLGEHTSTAAEWMLNARHQDALQRSRDALKEAVTAAQSDHFEECVALELRTALQSLGEIIGETPTEELLGQIFSQFCVGK